MIETKDVTKSITLISSDQQFLGCFSLTSLLDYRGTVCSPAPVVYEQLYNQIENILLNDDALCRQALESIRCYYERHWVQFPFTVRAYTLILQGISDYATLKEMLANCLAYRSSLISEALFRLEEEVG